MNILYFEQWSLNEDKKNSEFKEFHDIMKALEPDAPPAVSTYTDSFKTLQRLTKTEQEEIKDILKSNIFIKPLNLVINPNSAKKNISYESVIPRESYDSNNRPNINDISEDLSIFIVRWFLHAGISLEGACALAGNLWRESYFNPHQKQIGGGPGRGLAQWSVGDRWDTFTNSFYPTFQSSNPKLSSYSKNSLESQLSFIIYELKNNYRGVWNNLLTTGDLWGKTMSVLKKYEVPAKRNDPEEQQIRYEMASDIMNIVQNDDRLKFIADSVKIQKENKPQLFT